MSFASSRCMQRLIIMDDAGETSSIPLIQDEISIGREDGNVLRLTQRNISRRHARLVREDGVLYVEDLDSYNGVYVNGDRILGRVELRDGDELQVGTTS